MKTQIEKIIKDNDLDSVFDCDIEQVKELFNLLEEESIVDFTIDMITTSDDAYLIAVAYIKNFGSVILDYGFRVRYEDVDDLINVINDMNKELEEIKSKIK